MILFLSILNLILSIQPVYAARAGTVDLEGAVVFQFPDQKSPVLIKLHKGTRLVASNQPTLGFHKVRLRSSLVGWVIAKSLVLQPMLPAPTAASGEVEKPAAFTANDSNLPLPPGGP
jgi:hypothetical protein